MAVTDWHPNGLNAFFKSTYNYDDAALLASLWGIPIVEAKQAIGHKVINKIEDLLPLEVQKHSKIIDDGISKTFRAYANSEYDYDDAALLASLWNMSVSEAKDEIGYKVLNGLTHNLPQKLNDNNINEKHENTRTTALNYFFKSDYSYYDAELLSQLWNISIVESKKTIGYKVMGGIEHLLPTDVKSHKASKANEELENTASTALSYFFKSDYSYYDAELLSQLWSISLIESKKTIGYKLIGNIEHLLPADVKSHKASKAVDNKILDQNSKALNAYGHSSYDYHDAELLAQLWSISTLEAKKTIGYKLINGIEHFLPFDVKTHKAGKLANDKAGNQITEELKAFDNSHYSYDDAALLAQLWSLSTIEAKKVIGSKIINDIEHLLPNKITNAPRG